MVLVADSLLLPLWKSTCGDPPKGPQLSKRLCYVALTPKSRNKIVSFSLNSDSNYNLLTLLNTQLYAIFCFLVA